MKCLYIQKSNIKKLIKKHGKRTSSDYLELLDRIIINLIEKSLRIHNPKKTIKSESLISLQCVNLIMNGGKQ